MIVKHLWSSFAVFVFLLFAGIKSEAQTTAVIIPSNTSTGSLEKNILFRADSRLRVTHSGPKLTLYHLFDGRFNTIQTESAPTPTVPLVILIEGLPAFNVQAAAWIGWSSRYWYANRFRIEGYDAYNGANRWVNIADVSSHSQPHYMVAMPKGSYTKVRFTFYGAVGQSGILQLSELFFIHPEAGDAYDGLLVKYAANGNVGIGIADPQAKLAVNGNILAKEVKVKTDITVPDYVFAPEYDLPSLREIEGYVQAHRHLPGIPIAAEIGEDGLDLAEMNLLLLKKVEELTLYLIEEQKVRQAMEKDLDILRTEINNIKKQTEMNSR